MNIVIIEGPTGQVGPTGPQGITGLQGPAGTTGPDGGQGTTGPTGYQGPVGSQGPQGIQGPQGPQGITGLTGYQGTTGLTGPQGSQGIQGIQGPQGPVGNAGPQGVQGPQGIQGIAGPVGPTGLTGPQGITGFQGATGPVGLYAGKINFSPNASGATGFTSIIATKTGSTSNIITFINTPAPYYGWFTITFNKAYDVSVILDQGYFMEGATGGVPFPLTFVPNVLPTIFTQTSDNITYTVYVAQGLVSGSNIGLQASAISSTLMSNGATYGPCSFSIIAQGI